jgi:hypothetical protein
VGTFLGIKLSPPFWWGQQYRKAFIKSIEKCSGTERNGVFLNQSLVFLVGEPTLYPKVV